MFGNVARPVLAVACAALVLTGATVPFVSPAAAANADPDPRIADVDVPDAVTVGESFEVTVEGVNDGGRGGHFSTISVSSPTLDGAGDDRQVRVTDGRDHAYDTVVGPGETVYDDDGDERTARYVVAEGGTDGDSYWRSGDRRELSVEFTPEEAGTFVVYVRVTMPDDADPDRKFNAPGAGDRDQQGFAVRRYEVRVREEADRDARIADVDPASGTYRAGDVVGSEATVVNTGNREHTFYVGYSVRGPDGEWRDNDRTTHESVRLDPGEAETVSLGWEVPSDAPTGGYDLQTAVYTGEDDGLLTGRTDAVARRDAFGVEAERTVARIDGADFARGTYRPGDAVRTRVRVENTGTTDHRFYVGYSARGPDGEAYDEDGSTHESVWLSAGETETVTVEWTVPGGAPAGDYDLVTAVYRDRSGDGLVGRTDDRRAGDAVAVERPETEARIRAVDPAGGDYRAGETVRSRVYVENTGDTDHRFHVGYGVRTPGGEWFDDDGSSHESVALRPGEGEWVTVSVDLPSDAPTGTYDLRTAVYAGRESDGLVGRTDRATLRDRFEVTTPDVRARIADVDPPSGTYEAGETASASVVVENTGAVGHTYFVGYSLRGPDGRLYDDDGETGGSLPVAGGDRRRISLSWTVPTDAPSGAYDVITSVYEESDRSNLETRLDRAVVDRAVEVTTGTASVDIDGVDYASDSVARGEAFRATATVRNVGDRRETVFVGYAAVGPNGREFDDDGETGRAVTLDPGERRAVDLTWTPGADAPAGTYDVRVAVWAEDDRSDLETRLTERVGRSVLEVVETDALVTVSGVEPDADRVDRGGTLSASATVASDAERSLPAAVRLELRRDDGDWRALSGAERSATIPAGDRRAVEVTGRLPDGLSAGSYDLRVVAADADTGETLATGTADEAVEVTGPTGAVAVTVVGPAGDPVEGARVTVGPRNATTDDGGVATFDAAPVGEQTVVVDDTAFERHSRTITVRRDDPRNVEIRLGGARGEIVSVEGLPRVIGLDEWYTARVTVRNDGRDAATFAVRAVEASGTEFRSEPRREVELDPGEKRTVELDVRFYGNEVTRRFEVELASAAGRELDARTAEVVPGGTQLRVDVVDSTDRPISGATVRLVGRDGDPVSTNGDGTARLAQLDPGAVLVKVSLPDAVGVSVVREVSLVEGETRSLDVRLPQTAGVSGRVTTPDGTGLDDVTVEINGREAATDETGLFRFDKEFAEGPYLLRVERDGETIHRQSIDVSGFGRSILVEVDAGEDGDGSGDGGIISNAQKGAIFGEVGVQSGMAAASTVEYMVGWLGGSVVPVADAFADTRDCVLAPNAGLASNFIDCGGAVVSTVGSAGTVVGAITSPTGIGAAVGVGSFSLDTAEDVVTVSKHFVTWTAKNPQQADEAAAALISLTAGYASKAPGALGDVVRRIVREISERGKKSLASKVRTARLVTHLGRETTAALTRNAYKITDDWYRVEKVGGWLSDVRRAEGYDELTSSIRTYADRGDWNGVRGAVFEAKVASDYKAANGVEIEAIGRKIDGGELDVVTKRGDLMEVKSSREWRKIAEGHDDYEKLAEQVDRYKNYKRAENLDGDVAVVFPTKPSNDVYDLLGRKNVDCLVTTIDGGVVPCYKEPVGSLSADPLTVTTPAAAPRTAAVP